MNESRYSMKSLHEKAWTHARTRMAKARGSYEAKSGELRNLKDISLTMCSKSLRQVVIRTAFSRNTWATITGRVSKKRSL